MTYILIPVLNEDGEIIHGFNCYPTDTLEEIRTAADAMHTAGIDELPVWVSPTDEDSPDAYKNGKILLQEKRTDALDFDSLTTPEQDAQMETARVFIDHRCDGPMTAFVAIARACELSAMRGISSDAIANALDSVLTEYGWFRA